MTTKLKGYLEAARKLQLKIGSNPNEISELTTRLQELPFFLKAIFKGNSIQLHSTILKVDCLNYVLFPLFSLRGANVRRPRFSNKANDAFLAAAKQTNEGSRSFDSRVGRKMRKANIGSQEKKRSFQLEITDCLVKLVDKE